MKCYAVIDTNVLVSALLSSHNDAATVQVVDKIFSEEIVPLYSTEIIAEYNAVLHRKKFKFSDDSINIFRENRLLLLRISSWRFLSAMMTQICK